MASVKFYLDKRRANQNGEYPLKLAVWHRKTFLVSLDISIPEKNWIGNKIEGDIKNKTFINSYIQTRFSAVQNYLLTLKLWGKLDQITPEILKKLIEKLNPTDDSGSIADIEVEKTEKVVGENYLFRDHAVKFIESRNAKGTKATYQYTLDTLAKLYDLDRLTFSDIDYDWLEDLDIKLRPTCKVNTRSIHFRNIRAIFKNATKKKLVSKDLYPFEDFSIKNEETMHRNLSIDDMRTLRDYPVEPHQEGYRDLFMLLFYLIGINVVDLLHAESIQNGRLQYRRAKTGKLYDIKIHPEAMKIINKYSPGKKYLLNFLDNYQNYEDFRSRFNKNLKQIGPSEWISAKSKNGRPIKKKVITPLFPFLSSYYARHTWATFASDLDIPEKTIKMALGHGSRTVTDIYVNFDIRKVDEANRKVIDYLNGK
jgi:site-specific recombinase XerD